MVAPFAHPRPLTDGVVVLRAWEDRDLACVEQASSDPRIPTGTTVPAVFTPTEGLAWLARQRDRYDSGQGISFAVARAVDDETAEGEAADDEAVALVVLLRRPQEGVLGLGYWVVPAARGEGVAGRAVGLATAWALAEARADRVEAWVAPENEPSRRTLQRNGFVHEGRLRSFMAFAGVRTDLDVFSRLPTDPA